MKDNNNLKLDKQNLITLILNLNLILKTTPSPGQKFISLYSLGVGLLAPGYDSPGEYDSQLSLPTFCVQSGCSQCLRGSQVVASNCFQCSPPRTKPTPCNKDMLDTTTATNTLINATTPYQQTEPTVRHQ